MVSQITNMINVIAKVDQNSFDQVISEESSEVSDVCRVVNGWAAGIHGSLAGL